MKPSQKGGRGRRTKTTQYPNKFLKKKKTKSHVCCSRDIIHRIILALHDQRIVKIFEALLDLIDLLADDAGPLKPGKVIVLVVTGEYLFQTHTKKVSLYS